MWIYSTLAKARADYERLQQTHYVALVQITKRSRLDAAAIVAPHFPAWGIIEFGAIGAKAGELILKQNVVAQD